LIANLRVYRGWEKWFQRRKGSSMTGALAEIAQVEKARVFVSVRSQAVRISAQYRFSEKEVCMRRDPQSGDPILSESPGLGGYLCCSRCRSDTGGFSCGIVISDRSGFQPAVHVGNLTQADGVGLYIGASVIG
jgi:hypothetical protein